MRASFADVAGVRTRFFHHGEGDYGVLLSERGDLVGAEAAFRRADERGDASGAFNLGMLLEPKDDVATTQAAYRRSRQRSDGSR